VTWAEGHTAQGQITRPVAKLEQLSSYPRLIARIQDLAETGMTFPNRAAIIRLIVAVLATRDNVERETVARSRGRGKDLGEAAERRFVAVV
jgi:hypothetical protein